jgi:hypothetical protein
MNGLVPLRSSPRALSLSAAAILISCCFAVLPDIALSVPSGPTWEDSYEITIDGTEFKSGDIVTINVTNTFYSGIMPEITIIKGTFNDVVYKEHKNLTDRTVEFDYQIPTEGSVTLGGNEEYTVVLREPYNYGDTPIKTLSFTVTRGFNLAIPLILVVGAIAVGSVGFLKLRKRGTPPKP